MSRLRSTSYDLKPLAARVGYVGLVTAIGVSLSGFVLATPALAHHPFGGQTPSNFVMGFLSGLGHPVIGLDHLAFVVAVGLLAATGSRGLMIPVGFILMSLVGTGIHLLGLDLPALELFISMSVLLFGGLLATKHRPHRGIVATLAACAGIFHGYAYGEAVVGAEVTPLLAYLLGVTVVQGAIAAVSYWAATRLMTREPVTLRFAGFALAGAGAALLSSVVLG